MMRKVTWYPASRGDRRITSFFAFFPVQIGNDFRWLERVTIEWEYTDRNAILPPCTPYLKWQIVRFVDRKYPEDK